MPVGSFGNALNISGYAVMSEVWHCPTVTNLIKLVILIIIKKDTVKTKNITTSDMVCCCYKCYLVERTSLASMVRFSSLVIAVMPGVSNRFLIQSVCWRLLMNIYSAPICSQYIA